METAPRDASLLALVALLVRRSRLLIAFPLLTGLAALGVSFLLPERHAIEARFIPETQGSNASRLAGLASQFGVNVGGVESGESTDFYAELLRSRELLRAAVLTEYALLPEGATDSIRGTLVELLKVDGDSPDERIYGAVQELDDMVTTRTDPSTRIVRLTTSAPWPMLAVLTSQRLLELVNEFNLERRQSRAAMERAFLDARVQEVGGELRAAEAGLERFLSENRRYEESPQLRFEYGRLQRRVDLLQDTYTSLAQNHEQARLDEVRNTPVITVIDQPRLPAEQTAPNHTLNFVLGFLLGAALALGAIIGSDLTHRARRARPEDFAQLRSATREALGRGGRGGRVPAGKG